ncbi:AraC family transcriptional regulator [Streptomyces flavofungini]|uniref:AraC family transcriptional regulator n=1 Tax=Streptomyces flavofungini TaxID=68200 RepID=A0ABS0X8T7_9ACTN|nr:AraC family transcriptional regulator [Streptomyces flavofungini]MBJ3809617.1 AraC family transcriptional regulator [Streptomyces flavofungini]
MDVLAGLLEGPRARGAFMLRACFEPPWSVRIADGAPVSVMIMVAGEAWIVPENADGAPHPDRPPRLLRPGDVAIARAPDPYLVTGDQATPPFGEIGPGQSCAPLNGAAEGHYAMLGLRRWGQRDGAVQMLIGTYQMRGEITGRLLDALPPLLVLPTEVWDCPLTPFLAEEIDKDEPGQEVVLDRLLDLLLIAALRAWFSRPEAEPPAWYLAMGDPVVGPVLRLLQDDPTHPWTVASLAAKAGVSRAALARRFTELVGEPPMTYLTGWRLALAADLLRDSDLTIASIARKVGYGSAFALSSAFKREYGVSPQDHRTGAS